MTANQKNGLFQTGVKESPAAFIPLDRRRAMANHQTLPDRAVGAVLLADISGFTPLAARLVSELGPKGGASELTTQLNAVYSLLIAEVHRQRGSVVGFSGDAITCWFDDTLPQAGRRATTCALAMQAAIQQVAAVKLPSEKILSLKIKVAIVAGPIRRFRVGDPRITYIDALAGATLDRLDSAEKVARKGEIVIESQIISDLGDQITVAEWRQQKESQHEDNIENSHRFAVVTGLASPSTPLPANDIAGEDALEESEVRPWILPPVYERLRAGRGRFLAEIRPAVVLFLKFGNLDYDQDDAAGEKLDTYIRLVQNVLAQYKGYLLQVTIGEKGSFLYAAFGAPLAHDDDPSRAVGAALELRSLPAELGFEDQAQIGISRGRMWTGAYGSPTRRTYGVLGDEVNVAARLMQYAEPGQIIVRRRIAAAVAGDFRWEAIGPVMLKGKQKAVAVLAVTGRRQPSPGRFLARYVTPLVGRSQERALMKQILEFTLNGAGQILRVEGVAGVGKSHLATTFAKHALERDLHVAAGACQSNNQGIPYHPWRQIFRTLFDLSERPLQGGNQESLAARQIAQVESVVKRSNPAWLLRLPLLGDLLGLPIADNETTAAFDAQLRQEALISLAVDIIRSWADSRPLLLLLEDIHWMDESSQNLVMAVARIIARLPGLLLLVQRPRQEPLLPELGHLPHYHQVDLGELSRQEVKELAAQQLEGEPAPLALSLIHTLSQGNPFFARELTEAMKKSDRLRRNGGGNWFLSEQIFNSLREANCLRRGIRHDEWLLVQEALPSAGDLGIPDSIQELALSGLDHLTEAARLTLKVAGVIGYNFELDVLAQAHPAQPEPAVLLEQIRNLEARDFIRLETDTTHLTYAFKHHIIQETIYETLPDSQQRALHRAVGEAVEQLQADAVERLAYHFRRSGVRHKTLRYLDKAARKTQREYANETALNYYNQALALEERWPWRQNQVQVLHILGRRQEEAAGLQHLAANSEAPDFEVTYLQGAYFEAVSSYEQAKNAIEQALLAGRALANLTGEVRCLAQLGLIAYRQGSHKRAKSRYNQALALFQNEKTYPNKTLQAFAHAFNGLGMVNRQQGEFDKARACYKQALTLSRASGDRHRETKTLNDLGATAFHQRQFTEARGYQQQALAIQQAIGDRAGEGSSLYNLAIVNIDAGDYSQGKEYLDAALTILQATGNRWQEVSVWNSMGILYQELGLLAEAQPCLEQGLQLAREIGVEAAKSSHLLCSLGLVKRDQGDLGAAEKFLSQGLALMQTAGNKHQEAFFLSYLSSVSLQAGNLKLAVKRAQAALKLRKALNLRLRTADDFATLAAAHLNAGELSEALYFAQQSLAILEECKGEGPEFPQRDYFIIYRVMLAAGKGQQAKTALAAAHRLVMSRASKITSPLLRQSFLENVAVNREIVEKFKKTG